MAIFEKQIESTLALSHSLDREPMALNFSLESILDLQHQKGRSFETGLESELSLEQQLNLTFEEEIAQSLTLVSDAVGVNAGREIVHQLILQSTLVRAPSEFGRSLESELVFEQHVAVLKFPLREYGSYT